MPSLSRRSILYIRHKRTLAIAPAFQMNQDEWVEALGELANVTVQSEDFDLGEACDRMKPDLIIYESPFFHPASLIIRNIHSHPHIPRIAFFMQDPFCSLRVNFLRIVQDMNIHWIFTHLTEALVRQSPELKTRVFSLSLFFDNDVFHDYKLVKDIPVSVFGGFLVPEIYVWRNETAREIMDYLPTFIYTHPGYYDPIPRHKFAVVGEAYARMLNRSHFALADSTLLDYLVRKHLEIPASGAVLVAPDTPVLKPYGFRDMENCILGQGAELCDRIAAVADDPDRYETIRRNGYDLVQGKFSRKNWRGILDFLECVKQLKSGETIRQQGIFGPFVCEPAGDVSAPAIIGVIPDSTVSCFFQNWLNALVDESVSKDALRLPDWLQHMEESMVLLGVMTLLKGDAAQARELLLAPQANRQKDSGFTTYDPEEIAWLSLVAALTGNAALQNMTREQSASLRHLSLRRMRWLSQVLASGGDISNPPDMVLHRLIDDHLSIHWTGQLPLQDWLQLIRRILQANWQGHLLGQ